MAKNLDLRYDIKYQSSTALSDAADHVMDVLAETCDELTRLRVLERSGFLREFWRGEYSSGISRKKCDKS